MFSNHCHIGWAFFGSKEKDIEMKVVVVVKNIF